MVRRRIVSAFVRRGLIGKSNGEEMGSWVHGGGFSVDASVCIEGSDRPGLERLLRYCARPPFALEHLQQLDAEHLMEQLVDRSIKNNYTLSHTDVELIPAVHDG
ncbi:hypothetical protein GALLN_00511 [Gallionellaceae bacterium]|nr:hypothetical protein GALLN_00511 [Gallionellaceae bacterium]